MFTKNSLATLFNSNLIVSYWRRIRWKQTEQKVMTRLGAGFLVLIPLVLTILVGRFVYIWVEEFMAPFLETLFRRPVPGAGFITFILFLYFVGIGATSAIGRRAIDIGHNLFGNIPVIRLLYGAVKEAIDLVTVATDREFKRVVLVEYPRRGVKAIGFLTGQFEDEEGKQQAVVYIPTTPNPTSGYLAIISIDEIYPTDLKVDQAMKLIISGGIFASQALSPNTGISKIATDTK